MGFLFCFPPFFLSSPLTEADFHSELLKLSLPSTHSRQLSSERTGYWYQRIQTPLIFPFLAFFPFFQ